MFARCACFGFLSYNILRYFLEQFYWWYRIYSTVKNNWLRGHESSNYLNLSLATKWYITNWMQNLSSGICMSQFDAIMRSLVLFYISSEFYILNEIKAKATFKAKTKLFFKRRAKQYEWKSYSCPLLMSSFIQSLTLVSNSSECKSSSFWALRIEHQIKHLYIYIYILFSLMYNFVKNYPLPFSRFFYTPLNLTWARLPFYIYLNFLSVYISILHSNLYNISSKIAVSGF